MEDESFQLLSSMSPNVKHCQKHFRKGTTVLGLRKSLRRSSIFDKSTHTKNNNEIDVIECSSTTVSSISKSSQSCEKVLNRTPISIHDSDSESDRENKLIPKKELSPMTGKQIDKRNLLLSRDKLENIQHWLDEVNTQSGLKDGSVHSNFTELSTIYGEENNGNFVTERTGRAVTSTVIGSSSIHFEQLFKPKTDNEPLKLDINTYEPDIIDESYVEKDTSVPQYHKNDRDGYNVRSNSSTNGPTKSSISLTENKSSSNLPETFKDRGSHGEDLISVSDNSFSLNESLNTRLKQKKESNVNSDNSINGNENISGAENMSVNDLASMLDDLYGNKWREKEEHILPKSEPRKQKPKMNNIHIPNTERKPKLSGLYKNPYLETEKLKSNNLLENLHRSRLKTIANSHVIKQLNTLCASDTDSNVSDTKTNPRKKLNFTETDSENDFHKTKENVSNGETKSKYFKKPEVLFKKTVFTEPRKENESDKENVREISFLGQSLEERIQKKISGIKDIPSKSTGDKTPLTKKVKNNTYKTDLKISEKGEPTTDGRKLSSNSSSSDDEWNKEISKIIHESKPSNGKYSFLASLSANIPILQCDMSARIYRSNFKSYKDQLLKKLFKLYNEKVFQNALPHDTVLEWNDRMRGSAGFCYCKKITKRTGAVERTARIVLSSKVIDAAYRLRDTLIHEMCHAATWIVNCVSDGHGAYWKTWAYTAMKTFPELPPIKRCHDYVINTKYTYRCTSCGYSIGRHSKSLDIERKRCGHCYGKFEVFLNKVTKNGESKSVPATPKKEATGFALFVKENYSTYKQRNLKHGDVMKLLGQKFQEIKLKPS